MNQTGTILLLIFAVFVVYLAGAGKLTNVWKAITG